MSMKVKNEDTGEEVEVYTADELAAVRTETENKFKPQLDTVTKERDEARETLSQRSDQFKQFRKLNDEQVKQLSEKDRIIYENQLTIQEERNKNSEMERDRVNSMVDTAIRTKVGADQKAFDAMKKMWELVGITATTPEEIERKALIVLGALGQAQPDVVASINGFSSGSYQPPVIKVDSGFGNTDRGKQIANELGLTLEPPKK